jgi:hypothetical protein
VFAKNQQNIFVVELIGKVFGRLAGLTGHKHIVACSGVLGG